MINIRLDIAYDGTNYKGWQKQNCAPSIQGEIEEAIYKAFDQRVNLIASGRTDAGVHAYQQVANFICDIDKPSPSLCHWINDALPRDIRIIKSSRVQDEFHARFDAKSKVYIYRIYNDRYLHPIYRNHFQVIYNKVNIEIMKRAADRFLGTNDYAAFCASINPETNTVRKIDRIDIREEGPIVEVEFEAESFLRNQLRIITGTLVQISRGKIKIEDLDSIFEGRDRSKAGPTLTGSGLYLMEVKY